MNSIYVLHALLIDENENLHFTCRFCLREKICKFSRQKLSSRHHQREREIERNTEVHSNELCAVRIEFAENMYFDFS